MPVLSLSYYTCAPVTPIEQIRIAAEAGYGAVGLRPAQPRPDSPVQSILGDRRLIREIVQTSRDLGVKILDLEFVWLDAGSDPERCKGLVDLGAELGVEAILVGGIDPDWNRLADTFGKLCEIARQANLTVDLEAMPWARVSSPSEGARLIADAGHPANGKLLVDALHFFRANVPLADIGALPAGLIHSAQLCDDIGRASVSTTEAKAIANFQRLPPAMGALDLRGFVAALPAGTPIALEVPNERELERHGPQEWARHCHRALEELLAASAQERPER